jgi:4-diphosphocytidyl-2-C-methyl-D-erythritol kinase
MLTILAPAKINWSLYVLDKRHDGYHNILSLLHCVNLYDELTIEPSHKIEVFSNSSLPQEQNLVYKAALMLQKCAGINTGARIRLNKMIPMGAGLGGGSSDAANTLIGLNKFWELGFDNNELKIIGERLGSDVPFFFHPPIAFVMGRGELVKPLIINTSYTLLLVKPPVLVSTALAYDMLAQKRLGNQKKLMSGNLTKNDLERHNIGLIYKALVDRDFFLLKNLINNDFEPVVTAHFPFILNLKNELLNSGAYIAVMTGSGSAVFGLFKDRQEAVAASRRFKPYWHIIADTLKNS